MLKSVRAFNKKVIITETLQCNKDNLFEVQHKSKEDNLQDTVNYLHNILRSETPLQSHTNDHRAQAIDKLREIILQPTKSKEITTPLPRVRHNSPLLRVPTTSNDDPLELEEEADTFATKT